jgi:hypothetical protein
MSAICATTRCRARGKIENVLRSLPCAAVAALLLAACGSKSSSGRVVDGGADRNADATVDARTDAATDATADARTDATAGATADAHTDAATDATSGADGCAAVSFRVQAPPDGGAGYVLEESFGDPGDGTWWYSVAKADGTPVQIFLFYTSTTCAACKPLPVPIGGTCFVMPDGGARASWSGVMIVGTSTCQNPMFGDGLPCAETTCAPAGAYVVKMCGWRSAQECGGGNPDAGAACVSVPFTYPTATEVVGQLPP